MSVEKRKEKIRQINYLTSIIDWVFVSDYFQRQLKRVIILLLQTNASNDELSATRIPWAGKQMKLENEIPKYGELLACCPHL